MGLVHSLLRAGLHVTESSDRSCRQAGSQQHASSLHKHSRGGWLWWQLQCILQADSAGCLGPS